MAELASDLSVFRRLVGARIRSDWQYRTSFFLFLLSQTLVAGLDLAVILVLFTNVKSLAGWSVEEVALLYGVSALSFGFADCMVSQVELASRHIKAGTFDLFLLRPVGSLLQLCAAEFALRRIGRSIYPAVVFVVALTKVDIAWTPLKVALVPVTLVASSVMWCSLWIITSSISFWTVETQELANSFTYGGQTLSHYPIDVLGSWLRRIVTFVVPLAFTSYLPVAYLLDRQPAFGVSNTLAFASPLVALALALLANVVWRTAVRHYRSTGS